MLKRHFLIASLAMLAGCGVAPDMAPMAWQAQAKNEPVTPYGVTYCLELLDGWDRDRNDLLEESEYVDGRLYQPSLEDPSEEWMEETQAAAKARFAVLDSNHNGHLTIIELFPEYWNMPKPPVRPGVSARRLKNALKDELKRWSVLDADQSGFLHLAEFGTAGNARQIFRKLDTNQDTVLQFGEYLRHRTEFNN